MAIVLPASVKGHPKGTSAQTYGYGGNVGGWDQHTHKGDKVIFEADGKSLYAANGRGIDEFSGAWELIIDLASQVCTATGFVRPSNASKFDELRKYSSGRVIKSDLLSLEWPDMQAPPATLDFWLTLWDMLPSRTVACCIGGHGRTGTCLAALIIASGTDYYDAVQTVRTEHCNRAIESMSQETYLHRIYIENLERMLKIQDGLENPSTGEITDLVEAIKYAKTHVPTATSSFGTPTSGGSKSTGHGSGQHGPMAMGHVNPTDNGGQGTAAYDCEDPEGNWKVMNGLMYNKECTVKYCKASITITGCRDQAHMGWVPFDPEVK